MVGNCQQERLANISISITVDISSKTLDFLVFVNEELVGRTKDYDEAIDIAKRAISIELLSVKERMFLQRNMYASKLP